MSNDLQATITMQLGQALSSLKNVNAELKTMKRDVAALKAEKNAFQQQAAAGYQRVASEAKKATAANEGFGQTIQRTGGALSKFGGALGGIASRLGGAAGLSGGFGVAGIAAAVAGIAFTTFTRYAENAEQQVSNLVDEINRFNDAVKKGADQAASIATSGLSQEDTVRKLTFRAGPGAVDEAQQLAQDEGMSFKDAAEGMSELATIKDQAVRKRALDAALRARDTGEVSFTDATKQIASNPELQRRLSDEALRGDGWSDSAIATYGAATQSREVAARLVRMQTAPSFDPFAKRDGSGWEEVDMNPTDTMRRDRFLKNARAAKGQQARISAGERAGIARGTATLEASRQAAVAASPTGEAALLMAQEKQRELDKLQAESDGANPAMEWLRDRWWWRGEDSKHRKLEKEQQAYGEAALKSDINDRILSERRGPVEVKIVQDTTIRPLTY